MSHLVVGASQLEAEDGMLVFPLEQHIAFESIGQIGSGGQRGLFACFVDTGCEY